MEQINTRSLTTGWLIGLIALTLCLIPAIGGSTTTQVQDDVVMMNTTADTVNVSTTNFPGYNRKITGIKLVPITASKYHRLRVANVSGNILWEHRVNSTTDTVTIDVTNFRIPSTGIYYQTDDSNTTEVRIFLYSAQ